MRKYKIIGIAFTLKGQSFDQIKISLVNLQKYLVLNNPDARIVLVHGFMPKHEVVAKGFKTEVVDLLDELFPLQTQFYWKGKPQRAEMAKYLKEYGSGVYVIGDIKEGVQDEVDAYEVVGSRIFKVPLGWDGGAQGVNNYTF